jgi:hypothetical protein
MLDAPTHAQDNTKLATEKWRPTDGIYALSGKDFTERCENLGDFSVELREKAITGDEWSCKVIKLTDTGSGAIRLDMSCSDVNLEAEMPTALPSYSPIAPKRRRALSRTQRRRSE